MGPQADRMLDWLREAGVRYWQILPLGPVGDGGSPYDAQSAFAGNPLLISPELLVGYGLAGDEWLERTVEIGRVDYAAVHRERMAMLVESWQRASREKPALVAEAARWSRDDAQSSWLEDWVLFRTLKDHFDDASWQEWERQIRMRDTNALEKLSSELADERAVHRWAQFLFFRQWSRIRNEAARRGLRILGDAPIYVSLDSADVWAHPELFQLNAERRPVVVSGVPPDYFAKHGQRWGNPLYDWPAHQRSGYRWWAERIAANLRMVDVLRLDHFRAFAGYWEIPSSEPTAVNGRWRDGPGMAFFDAVFAKLGRVPLVAEDLGLITPDVHALRHRLGIPGMKVIQFGFGEPDNEHLPHMYGSDVIGYTATHDNDTTRGWFESAPPDQRKHATSYLGTRDPAEIPWRAIEAVCRSRAGLAIFPVQDVLSLGSSARLNTPGTVEGNWRWRAPSNWAGPSAAARLHSIIEKTGRA